MSNDIYKIVERLAILEGRITPTDVNHGLNQQQKSVKQLPALFKPKDISPTLSKPPYQKHPMDGWLVGEEADEEADKEVIEEAQVEEEKLLDKVKKSLIDYLDSVDDAITKKKDQDLSDRPKDKELGKKSADRDLVAKPKELDEDPTQEDPVIQPATTSTVNPTYAESSAIKSIAMEDGALCEIHGDMHRGFEIRHGNRSLKSRFKTLEQAEMAVEMYRARCRKNNSAQDYMEER
jgi:hypothetical protein